MGHQYTRHTQLKDLLQKLNEETLLYEALIKDLSARASKFENLCTAVETGSVSFSKEDLEVAGQPDKESYVRSTRLNLAKEYYLFVGEILQAL